ncbi:sensor histidine kinase [Bdellovibrio sp.]|uniref:sensor histidine kinase n=1 Tax=Bdellovibrio sp. TaxID=28201 RepID=UPI0039E24828
MIKLRAPTLTIGMLLSILVSIVFSLLTGIIVNRLLNQLRERTYLAVAKVLTESPDFEQNLLKVTQYIVPSSRSEYPMWVLDSRGGLKFSNRDAPPPAQVTEHFNEMLGTPKNTYNEIIPSLNPFSTRYILVNPADTDLIVGFRDDRKGPIVRLSIIIITAVFISCFFVYLASISAMIFYLKRKTLVIDETLMEIEKGHLSKRVSLSRLDKATGIIPVFNQMADKLQIVGEKLQSYEKERLQVLQELAHDLRTPLTSLTGASQTLIYAENLPQESRQNLLQVISSESQYLNKLIEDLFFLAEIQARRGSLSEKVNLVEVASSEVQKISTTHEKVPSVSLNKDRYSGHLLEIDPIFAKRLISNLLENAINAHAKSIQIEIADTTDHIMLKIWNDGIVPTQEQILQYGQKKKSRSFNGNNFKGSLGLGTVIIRSIVESQKGRLDLKLTESPPGFEVCIMFPFVN